MTTPLYLRVKRYHQTFCLLCDRQDSIQSIKQRVAACLAQHHHDDQRARKLTTTHHMRLLLPDQTYLEDSKTIQQYCDGGIIQENAVLYLVLAVDDDNIEYEAVNVASTDFKETTTTTDAAAAAAGGGTN